MPIRAGRHSCGRQAHPQHCTPALLNQGQPCPRNPKAAPGRAPTTSTTHATTRAPGETHCQDNARRTPTDNRLPLPYLARGQDTGGATTVLTSPRVLTGAGSFLLTWCAAAFSEDMCCTAGLHGGLGLRRARQQCKADLAGAGGRAAAHRGGHRSRIDAPCRRWWQPSATAAPRAG